MTFISSSPGVDKQKFLHEIGNIFLLITFSIGFGCSKEPSHCDGGYSKEPSHCMFWLGNKKIIFCNAFLSKGLIE